MPLLNANGLIEGAPMEPVPNTSTVNDLMVRNAPIAITFPAFSDGRGFSLARALRAAGYAGRLRASGELIPDQFAFALECGFDEIEISDERLARQPVEQWLAARDAVTVSYQPSRRITDILARRKAAVFPGETGA